MHVYDRPIAHPAAWRSGDLQAKDSLKLALTAAQLSALDEVLARTAHLPPQAVTREQFQHPALDSLLKELFQLLQHGRGVVVITGLDPSRHSEEQMERIYWGFGTHWGSAAVQSASGERLGHVQDDSLNPKDRGYRSSRELKPHTDSYELVGLLCLQSAIAGGETQVVSSLALHNEILATRPELLPALYEGYYYAPNEARGTENPVTAYRVPVFCNVGGVVSCAYLRVFMESAARLRGESLPEDLRLALDVLDELAQRPDLRMEFTLEPGEMLICNNYTTLHSRNEFRNGPGHQRHLLRLWLDVPDGRPVVPEFARRSREYRAREARSQAAQAS